MSTVIIHNENLPQELQQGNEAALAYLYDHYSGALYGVLLQMTGDENVSQDLLQEAFVKIWKNAAQYDAQKGRLYTWLLNITRNLAIDYLRSKRNKNQKMNRPVDSLVHGLRAGDNFQPQHIGLRELVSNLPSDQQQILQLSYFEGYTQQEIAEECDIPLGTVKSRGRAALKKLKQLFNPE